MNIARAKGIDFDALLLRYFQEKFLYLLAISRFSDHFVLKEGLFLIFLDFFIYLHKCVNVL